MVAVDVRQRIDVASSFDMADETLAIVVNVSDLARSRITGFKNEVSENIVVINGCGAARYFSRSLMLEVIAVGSFRRSVLRDLD